MHEGINFHRIDLKIQHGCEDGNRKRLLIRIHTHTRGLKHDGPILNVAMLTYEGPLRRACCQFDANNCTVSGTLARRYIYPFDPFRRSLLNV